MIRLLSFVITLRIRWVSAGPHPTVSSTLLLLTLLHRERAQVRHRHPQRSDILIDEGRRQRQERTHLLIEDRASDAWDAVIPLAVGDVASVVASLGQGWVAEQWEQGS